MFDSEEAKLCKKTKVPVLHSYNEWDCTNLFQATIFARSFASPASTGSSTTLNDLYVKPRAVPYGSFHACVVSPGGNMAETFALAIDQLRLLRNSLCHSISSEMDKATFDQRVNYAKDAFQALGVPTAPIDALSSLTESDFPTNKIRELQKSIKEETREYIKFLEEMSSDVIEMKTLLNAIKQTADNTANQEDIAMLEQKIAKLQVTQLEGKFNLNSTGRLTFYMHDQGTEIFFPEFIKRSKHNSVPGKKIASNDITRIPSSER